MTLGDAVAAPAVQFESLLENGDRVLGPLGIDSNRGLTMGDRIIEILCRSLAKSDFEQIASIEQRYIPVVVQRDPPARMTVLEHVDAEESRIVVEIQNSQHGRRHVDLACERLHPARLEGFRRVEQYRKFVGPDGSFFTA